MEKYLIRGGADPLKQYRPREILKKDALGGNSGNLMFLYGTMNVLTTSRTECVSTYYKTEWTDAEIDEINQTYSAFVLPLADAFRANFIRDLNAYTKLIRKLKIPCVVNGVGLRAMYEPQLEETRPFDEDVREFVKAVLDHSAMLGLRGGITGDYLSKLGFAPERDFTVIGCPSMYMYGNLPERKQSETDSVKIAVNLNGLISPRMADFYVKLLTANPDSHIIQQRTMEMIDLYYHREKDLSTNVAEFPNRNIFKTFDYASMKAEGRVHFFTSVPVWIDSMQSFDLFVGSRFHGTVAAILAGVPAVITPFDARTREFAEYHRIPTITDSELDKEITLSELQQLAEEPELLKTHARNLEHYKSFLARNGLFSIFEEEQELSFGRSVMEAKGFGKKRPKVISAYEVCNPFAKLARKAEYVEEMLPTAGPQILLRYLHKLTGRK